MSNEAAERLRERLGLMSEGPQSRRLSDEMLDAALAGERKVTVERIRAAWTFDHHGGECEYPHEQFDAILAAQAAKGA